MPGEESQKESQRGRGRPRDTRIDEAVPEAVLAVLDEKGYPGLTLEEVAARAGTTKPALRRRWRTKQHLVVDALLHRVGAAPTPDTGCTHCDLIAGIDTLSYAFANTNAGRVVPALIVDLKDDPGLEAEFFDKFFHPRRATTATALRRGIERGDIREDADIDLLLDMLGSTAYYRALFRHLPLTDTLAEEIVEVVMAGVATDRWRAHDAHTEDPGR